MFPITGTQAKPERLILGLPAADGSLVVEIDADAAYEQGNWRHLTHLIRAGPDLQPDELPCTGRAAAQWELVVR